MRKPNFDLLSTNNKLEKQADGAESYLTAGLSLAPHWLAGLNESLCVASTVQCRAACNLWFAGRTVTKSVRNAMIRRARELAENPVGFRRRIEADIERLILEAKLTGAVPVIRPNVASDHNRFIDWIGSDGILRQFEGTPLVAYDYTKRLEIALSDDLPANYSLTYSRSERSSEADCEAVFSAGRNVAIVFDVAYQASGRYRKIGQIPKRWHGRPVIDGDIHDMRFLDPAGRYIGLRLKGTNASKSRARIAKNGSSFAQSVERIRSFQPVAQSWIDAGFTVA